jgi:hypothetical protein
MEWTDDTLKRLYSAFVDKYASMNKDQRTDRANMSAIWNKHLKGYDIRVVRNENGKSKMKRQFGAAYALQNLIHTINFKNSCVADALIIDNPDRPGQYLLVPREKAELILVLGMM